MSDDAADVAIVEAWRDAAARAFFFNVWPMYVHELSGFDTDFYQLDESGRWQPDIAGDWVASVTPAENLRAPRAEDDPAQPFQRTHVITRAGRPVGFACVGVRPFKYMAEDVDQTIAELFLIHSARGDGTAARAVELVLREYSGQWSMLVIHDNARAAAFWRKTLPRVGAHAIEEQAEDKDLVLRFTTGSP
jgi:predicted acetyltransferase